MVRHRDVQWIAAPTRNDRKRWGTYSTKRGQHERDWYGCTDFLLRRPPSYVWRRTNDELPVAMLYEFTRKFEFVGVI